MLFLLCTLLAASFLFGRTTATASDSSSTPFRGGDSHIQVLKAINVRSELERREVDFTPKHIWEHHYADHMSLLRGASARFAKTSMRFKLPALALEVIETHLENIECADSVIVLDFMDELALKQAKREWDKLPKFIVISSHPGCNEDGERVPYVVSDVNYNTNRLTAVLLVHRVEWKAACASIKVDFGMTDESPSGQYSISGIRFHDEIRLRLGRRQAAASSTVTQAAASSSVVYPSAPTSTPSSESSVQNVSFSLIDQQSIISWDDMQSSIGCKNCSLVGSLEITHGTFTINSSAPIDCQIDDKICQDIEEAYQFIESGFFNAIANGFNAHVELDTSLSLTASHAFSKDIFTIGLPGFQIPDIAVVGPQFNVAIEGSIDIANEVNFTYGFDLTIPDGSSINIDVDNLTNSTQQGFSNATITPTPFTASSDVPNLTFSLGLHSEVLLGINVLSGLGTIYAGIFLDLPTVSVNISSLSGVNAHCEPLTSSNSLNGLSHVFPQLTNIVPMAGVNFGLEAGASADLLHVQTVSYARSATLVGTEFPLETACLSWDENATKFVEPTFSTTSTTAAASETGGQKAAETSGQKGSSGSHLWDENPFAQTTGIVWATGMVLGCVALPFAAL